MAQTAGKSVQKASYGLRREILISDGDPGAVVLDDGSYHHSRGHDPAGVRARLPATAHAVGQSLYVSPTLSGLGITNKTIGSPRQIQMSLGFIF